MPDAVAVGILVFVVGWIVPSISLVPIVARARLGGWTVFFGWMIVSLLFSPLLALIALVAMPPAASKKEHDDDERMACPFCAEEVRLEATLCPHCRSDLRRETAADRLFGPRS